MVQHTLNNPVHARFIRFNVSLLLISLVWGWGVCAVNTESSRVIFFSRKNYRFQELWNTFFFYLPWFISEKLGLGCLLEGKVLLFRSEVANLTKTLRAPHGNVSSETVVCVEMPNYGLENLQQISELYGYDSLNLLSCWTTRETLETQPRKD